MYEWLDWVIWCQFFDFDIIINFEIRLVHFGQSFCQQTKFVSTESSTLSFLRHPLWFPKAFFKFIPTMHRSSRPSPTKTSVLSPTKRPRITSSEQVRNFKYLALLLCKWSPPLEESAFVIFEELKSYSAWFNLKSIERILREILVHTVKRCVLKYLFILQSKKWLNFSIIVQVHIAKWSV